MSEQARGVADAWKQRAKSATRAERLVQQTTEAILSTIKWNPTSKRY